MKMYIKESYVYTFQYVEIFIFPTHRLDGFHAMEKDVDMKEPWMTPIFILNYTGCSKLMEFRSVNDAWMIGELTSPLPWRN